MEYPVSRDKNRGIFSKSISVRVKSVEKLDK